MAHGLEAVGSKAMQAPTAVAQSSEHEVLMVVTDRAEVGGLLLLVMAI